MFSLKNTAARAYLALAVASFIAIIAIIYFRDEAYVWVKAIHVMAVIAWMAGLLYLPRLFVYHVDAPKGSELSETLKTMERRLFRIIMVPAMAIVWILGLWMAWHLEWYYSGWFIAKFILVIILSGIHDHLKVSLHKFANDENKRSARYWRMMNEAPAVLMICIVILVIVKPF